MFPLCCVPKKDGRTENGRGDLLEAMNIRGSLDTDVPDGLSELLRNFTLSVLREKPSDLSEYAVTYFTDARDGKQKNNHLTPAQMYIIVDDDDDAGEPDKSQLKPKCQSKSRYARRQSVSAERYDPEEEADTEKIIHPKSDEQKNRLAEAVSGILLFKSLDSDQMKDVLDAMFERQVKPCEDVIIQGDDGDNFYVIDVGTYDVYVTVNDEKKRVHVFEDKGSFGELALMYNMPRSATVVARTEGTLWAMSRASFRMIVLKAAFKKRKMYEELLEGVPMLKSLDQYERMNLADALIPKTFKDQSLIIKEMDRADGMYFIVEGEVRITVQKDGKEVEVARSGPGKYFGEMALVEKKPRSANVCATSDVKTAFLERESFERLLGPCLDIMKRNIADYKDN